MWLYNLIAFLSIVVTWHHVVNSLGRLHVQAQSVSMHHGNNNCFRPRSSILTPFVSYPQSSWYILDARQNRKNRYHLQRIGNQLCSAIDGGVGGDYDARKNDNMDVLDARNKITVMENITDNKSKPTSFLRSIDDFGMKLKPWALSAYRRSMIGREDGITASTKIGFKSILYRIQSNILWMMYILYRGYRGFFVILPAVFREVYAQLNESDLVVDVYGDEEMEEKEYAVNTNASQNEQIQQPLKLRTRLTISILSGILTLSYVISGALRVLGKFIKTFTNTTSLEASLEAAADEVIDNENKLQNTLKFS